MGPLTELITPPSQAFSRRKPNSWPIKCRWVTDFRDLNKALNRPIWGGESSGQLLRQIDPSARCFAVFDEISGFHQVAIDTESSKLLNITSQMGNFRYTVLGQGLCCSQYLFNFITSGSTQTDPTFNILKNVDDFCLFSDTIEGLEMQINKLMKICEGINLKLSPSKFKLSSAVKFGGTIISSQKIKDACDFSRSPRPKDISCN